MRVSIALLVACTASPPPAPPIAAPSPRPPEAVASAAPSPSASIVEPPKEPTDPPIGAITEVSELPDVALPPETLVPSQLKPAVEKAAYASAVIKKGDLTLADGTKISGPCWDINKHTALESHMAEPAPPPAKGITYPASYHQMYDVDLDADGTNDVMVGVGAFNISTQFFVYLRRGGCGYYLGALALEGDPEPTKEMQKGLSVLEYVRVCRKCCREKLHVRMTWNGKKYVASKAWNEFVGGCKAP